MPPHESSERTARQLYHMDQSWIHACLPARPRRAAAAPPTNPACASGPAGGAGGGRSGSVPRHAAPCTHYHARGGDEQEHALAHGLTHCGRLNARLGCDFCSILLLESLADVGQKWVGGFSIWCIVHCFSFYWTLTLFGEIIFRPPLNILHFLLLEDAVLVIIWFCLNNFGPPVFVEILTWISHDTSPSLKARFGSAPSATRPYELSC
jgi:hypothetical protein